MTFKVDAVFEGGGVRGIGLVGAAAVVEERGYVFENLAGTSAGAIVASLLAAGYTARELAEIMRRLDYKKFLDASPLERVPLAGPVARLLFELGLYRGDYFESWLRGLLEEKGKRTFADLVMDNYEEERYRYRLQVIVSDISTGDVRLLPRDARDLGCEPDKLDIASAVRMSMSIPVLFAPVRVEDANGRVHFIVDGGVLSNFPVWIFDSDGPPRWPTFGFRLVDGDAAANEINGIVSFMKAIANTVITANDNRYVKDDVWVRTIAIPTGDVRTADFGITADRCEELYQAGRQAANAFLRTWDFMHYRDGYRSSTQDTPKFASYGVGTITGDRAAREVTIWQTYRLPVAGLDATALGLGGWTISAQHVYEPQSGVTFFGDGERRHAQALVPTMHNMPGSDGYQLSNVAFDPAGTLYMSEPSLIRALPLGSTSPTTIAGGGSTVVFSDNADPLTLSIGPKQIAFAPDGSLLVADQSHHRVIQLKMVAGAWKAFHVAGSDTGAASTRGQGDGSSATAAYLTSPTGLAVASDGTIYVSDATGTSDAIRRITPDGIIDSVVGKSPASAFPPAVSCNPAPSGGCGRVAAKSATISSATITDLEFGPDNQLYFRASAVIGRLGPDSTTASPSGDAKVEIIAGLTSGTYNPDGSTALQTSLSPSGFTFDREGRLYISEAGGSQRIRVIGQDGIVHTYAGTTGQSGTTGASGQADGLPARCGDPNETDSSKATLLSGPIGLAAAPNGDICVADSVHALVRCIRRVDTGISSTNYLVPDASGSVVYEFDSTGRHIATLNGRTGSTLLTLNYDPTSHLLTSLVDAYGNTTRIARSGTSVTISAYDDGPSNSATHTTTLTLTGNYDLATSYVHTVQSQVTGETVTLNSSSDGLLSDLTEPTGAKHLFAFDSAGLLLTDQDPMTSTPGSRIARSDQANGFAIKFTSPMGKVTNYSVDHTATSGSPDRLELRSVTDAAGLTTSTETTTKGQTSVTLPSGVTIPLGTNTTTLADGTVVTSWMTPDPRLGMAAAFPSKVVLATGTKSVTRSQTRTAGTLSDPQNIFTESNIVDTLTWPGTSRSLTQTFDPSAGTVRVVTGLGRGATTTIDSTDVAKVRPSGVAYDGITNAVSYHYDTSQRFDYALQGNHKYQYAYFSSADGTAQDGYVKSITESSTASGGISYATTYTRDSDGRATAVQLPTGDSSHKVQLSFDGAGNLTWLKTPQGSNEHDFTYQANDLLASVLAPSTGVTGPRSNEYTYDYDGNLLAVATPSGTLQIAYDFAGRPQTSSHPLGTITTNYSSTTGHVSSVNTTLDTGDQSNLAYTYDGSLLSTATTSGLFSHAVGWTYDALLEPQTRTIDSANSITAGYDTDGFLTSVGSTGGDSTNTVTYSYSSQSDGGGTPSWLVQSAQYGVTPNAVKETYTYDANGALTDYQVIKVSGSANVYHVQYARDAKWGGRVSNKTETIGAGSAVSSDYTYAAGHGADFASASAKAYAEDASAFLQRSQAEGLPTKIDGDGVIRVYDSKTNTFGAFNADGTTRTFFKPSSSSYWSRQPGSAPWTPGRP